MSEVYRPNGSILTAALAMTDMAVSMRRSSLVAGDLSSELAPFLKSRRRRGKHRRPGQIKRFGGVFGASRRQVYSYFSVNEDAVNRLTNWQRTQWARAGYPLRRVAEFAAMERS